MDSSGTHFPDEQDIKAAQPDGVESEKVGGQQPGGLGAQEGPPPGVATPWRRAQPRGGQNPSDRARAHAVPQSGQFSLEASISPRRIFLCQAQHQSSDLVINRWAA
jgi:hypothetical protein